jgi:hypothetical protein
MDSAFVFIVMMRAELVFRYVALRHMHGWHGHVYTVCERIWIAERIVLVVHRIASDESGQPLPHMHELCDIL